VTQPAVHDPESGYRLSRLREASTGLAGEGRSEKIMLRKQAKAK
jgi:hypothetical protein